MDPQINRFLVHLINISLLNPHFRWIHGRSRELATILGDILRKGRCSSIRIPQRWKHVDFTKKKWWYRGDILWDHGHMQHMVFYSYYKVKGEIASELG
jgi:hypothetical protein